MLKEFFLVSFVNQFILLPTQQHLHLVSVYFPILSFKIPTTDRFAQQTKLNIASPAAFAYQHYSSISASSSSSSSLLQACV